MGLPKAYDPIQGQKYQIFWKYNGREWEHCDYAATKFERNELLREYRLAYNSGQFKWIELPQKYWNNSLAVTDN